MRILHYSSSNPKFASRRAVAAARQFMSEAIIPSATFTVADEDLDFDILGRPPTPEEERDRDREEWRRGLDIQRGFEILRARAVRRRHPRPRRAHARIRARRSPASQRRATTDSGGDDGGGSGDPEPPRPRCNLSPVFYRGAL